MKRAILTFAILLISGALFAQVRGVPASVSSYGPGRGMAPGVPASVTSLGPNHILVGSGISKQANGDILWATNPIEYLNPYVTLMILIVVAFVAAYFAIRKRLIVTKNGSLKKMA